MPAPPAKARTKPVTPDAPIINEEADRILGRLSIQTIITLAFATLVVTLVMSFFNVPHTRLFAYHKQLDMLSTLLVLAPFYWSVGRLFSKRLEIGRDLVAKRQWKQAVAALDQFNTFGNHMMDRSGEAHYLLSIAYAGEGAKLKAEKVRQFVVKHRPGPWAVKLGGAAAPVSKQTSDAPTEQTRPRPPKTGPKRRF